MWIPAIDFDFCASFFKTKYNYHIVAIIQAIMGITCIILTIRIFY